MKCVYKYLFIIILIFLKTPFLFSQITLDRAISESVRELDTRLEPRTVVAMVNFNSESERMTDYVINEIHKNLVNSNIVRVVERNQIDTIIAELNLQMSGYISEESFQGIGHMLGAENIITGSIVRIDNIYRFSIQAMNVRTAEIQASYSVNVENDRLTASLMGGRANVFGLGNYTAVERHGAFFLNLIPFPSLGSWLMGDYVGGAIGSGVQLAGLGLMIAGTVYNRNNNNNLEDGLIGEAMALVLSGLAVWIGGYTFNLVRPHRVQKPQPNNTAISIDNFGIRLIPNGNESIVQLNYKMSF